MGRQLNVLQKLISFYYLRQTNDGFVKLVYSHYLTTVIVLTVPEKLTVNLIY